VKSPRQLVDAEGATTSRRITDAALQLFFERGYSATSVREIALASGLTPGAISNHFDSKEALLTHLVAGAHVELENVLTAGVAAGGDDPVAQLRELVRAHVIFHTRHRELARIANQEIGSLPDPGRTQVVQLRRRLRLLFNEVLERGVRAGVFDVPDIRITGLAIINMGIRVADWYRPGGSLGDTDVADVHALLALRMAGADG
jgi:AcrR family transcriptional regulator